MFKHPFSFKGRIRRLEYILSLIILHVTISLFSSMDAGLWPIIGVIGIIISILLIFTQGAKRCHDRGNSGWYQLIPFYSLWMIFGGGDKGINEYGPNPKEKCN